MTTSRPSRFVPARPFPPYSYVPGMHPHPHRDPSGHSYGAEVADVKFDERNWQDCEAYLFAIDLFNHGYYWEAHESWESVWIAVGRRGATAAFIKGLIKLAAAGVKRLEGNPAGAERHVRRAAELFQQTPDAQLLGLSRARLLAIAESGMADAATSARPLIIPNVR